MRRLASPSVLLPLAIGLAAFALYAATLAPGLLPADSGEFQLVAATLGIAHPPGYPLYTLLGWLFTRLTPGDPAWGLNLLSALLAAPTLAVVAGTVLDLTPREDPTPGPPTALPAGAVSPSRGGGGEGEAPSSLLCREGGRRVGSPPPFTLLRREGGRGVGSPAPPSPLLRREGGRGVGSPASPSPLLRREGGRGVGLAGLAAVLALAGAPTFWAQATTANIRILAALFAALILALALRALAAPTPQRLAALTLVTALGLGHHGSLAFIALPAWLAVALAWLHAYHRGRRDTRLLPLVGSVVLAGVVGLLPLLYLPLRGAPGLPPQPDALNSLSAWLDHALARGFRGDMFAFARADLLGDRLLILADILRLQFGWPLLAVGAVGLVALLRRPLEALTLGGAFALAAFVAITYRAPQTVEYMLPAYVALALVIGVGLRSLGATRGATGTVLTLAPALIAAGLGVWNIAQAGPSFAALSHDDSARADALALLAAAPPAGRVLAAWHQAPPLWYLQYVEGRRPDVRVEYVAPAGAEPYPATWRRRLEQATLAGPTLATNRYTTYQGAPFSLAPAGPGFLALRGDPPIPPTATPLDVAFNGGLRLLAAAPPPAQAEAGQSVTVDLVWRTEQAPGAGTGFYIHLLDAAGQVVGQADVSRSAGELEAGRVVVTRHTAPVLPTTTPGVYRLVAGAYRVGAGGLEPLRAEPVPLGSVQVEAASTAPVLAQARRETFPGGVTLVGSAWDTTLPAQARLTLAWRRDQAGPPLSASVSGADGWSAAVSLPDAAPGRYLTTVIDAPSDQGLTLTLDGRTVDLGRPGEARWLNFGGEAALVEAQARREGNTLVVDLTWLALRPLTRDYTVTVKARGPGWSTQSDGTPAGGAIPTLKWIAGMEVHDRHRLPLPQGAVGPATISVGLYDAFTATPLTVLDDRLLRQGQGEEAPVLVGQGF